MRTLFGTSDSFGAPFGGPAAFAGPATAAPDADGVTAAAITLPSPTPTIPEFGGELTTEPVENGIPGFPVATVGPTGLQYIDGLLAGKKWDSNQIYYSDPDSVSDYQANYPANALQGFHQLSANQLAAVHLVLGSTYLTDKFGYQGYSFEGFTNLDVSYFDGGTGYTTLRFGNNTDAGTAYAWYPDTHVAAGDVWFGGSGNQPGAGQLRPLHRHPRDRPCARAQARARNGRLRRAAVRHQLDGILGDDLQVIRRVGREVRLQRGMGLRPDLHDVRHRRPAAHVRGGFQRQRRQYHLHLEPDHRRVLRERGAGDRARAATASSRPSGTAMATTATTCRTIRPTSRST